MKEQVYKDPRPAEHFDVFHKRTRENRPDWVYEAVRLVLTPLLYLFYRARCIDSDNVPADGPVIIAPNHFSFLDHFFVAVFLRRKVHFMAKSQLFKPPMQFVFTHGGVFPVRRGHADEEAFMTAHAILDRGDVMVMYAEARALAHRRARHRPPRPRPARARVRRRRSCRARSPAPRRRATGSACSSPRSRSSSASRCTSSRSRIPRATRRRPPRRWSSSTCARCTAGCASDGRRSAVAAARRARRATDGTGRRPVAD